MSGGKKGLRLGQCVRLVYERCAAGCLDSPAPLTRHLRELAKAARLTVVRAVTHRYRPQGITVVLILKESHLVLHTWPEHDAAVLELFSCAPRTPVRKVEALLKRRLRAASSRREAAFVSIGPPAAKGR